MTNNQDSIQLFISVAGTQFECHATRTTRLSKLAVDFFKDCNWSTEHGAVIDLVGPGQMTSAVRLNGQQTISDAGLSDGAVLRILPELTSLMLDELRVESARKIDSMRIEVQALTVEIENLGGTLGAQGSLEKQLQPLRRRIETMATSDRVAALEKGLQTLHVRFETAVGKAVVVDGGSGLNDDPGPPPEPQGWPLAQKRWGIPVVLSIAVSIFMAIRWAQ